MKKEILRMQDVYIGSEIPYALDGFNLHISEGEMIGIVGLSGSGKTTIYEHFMGLVPLKSGKVTYNGVVGTAGEYFKPVTEVVCIGRNSTLIPGLSVAENIFLITGKRKVKGVVNMKHINYRAKMLLGQYAPGVLPTTPASQLSPAESRMVELMRAIENEVKLVVIDDVFQGFGQNDTLRLLELLQILKEKKIAILYTCHEIDFVHSIMDKLIVLRKGKNIRTFYGMDFDGDLCRRLLTGNEELAEFKRSSFEKKQTILSLRGLGVRSQFQQIDMEIKAGEIVGLYDMNNQINMELLSVLVGEREITEGAIYLDGVRYVPNNLDDAIAMGVGYIPRSMDEHGLISSMNFSDNLSLPILKKTSRWKMFRNRHLSEYLTDTYAARMGIPYKERYQKIKFYDRYIQQNIIMQRWVLFRPKVMVCMEPCLNADMIMRDIIFKALDEMAGNGSAVLLASQNINELKMVCDTIYVFSSNMSQNIEKYNRNEF